MPRRNFLTALGPGLITGASDDDPSGIATYSQVGARFGFGLLWTMAFSYPLMVAIQEICARVGRVTGRGLAGNIRQHYSAALLYPVVGLMIVANVINLGADIGAMGAAMGLLVGGPSVLYATAFAALSVVLQILLPYSRYVNVLKWLTLALFAYVATVFAVHVPWGAALRSTLLPHLELRKAYVTGLIAVLGTTISPYLFFWQASEEAEEEKNAPAEHPLKHDPSQALEQFARIRLDTYVGMAFSNLVAFFIILTTAATLHAHGVTPIDTAAQAATALRPVAGKFASLLFSMGIIGTGLLAIPVLAGSAAYAVGEALQWPTGLERKPHRAKAFYAVLALATALGLAMNYVHFDPIQALFWSAVINGVIAVPLMVVIMVMTVDPRVMGRFTLPHGLRVMGWVGTVAMFAAALGLLFTGNG